MTGGWPDSIGVHVRSLQSDRRPKEFAVRVGRVVFGDRIGMVLWLGIVLWLALLWRVGFFITDTYPIANAVANLAEGRLAMQPADFQYSLTLGTQPGLHEYQGRFYARNYGQVVAALPLVWLLEAASVVATPRLVLAGAWSFGVVLFGRELASLLGRPRIRVAGGCIATVSMLGAVAFATSLSDDQLPLVALQLSTLFAAGLAGVFCYRLVGAFHDQGVAIAGGVGLALATPVGFWATIPKRHVLVTALVFASVFAFARSRQLNGRRSDLALGAAYGSLGLVAWVHAFEGFFLTMSLFVVDVVTEPRKGKRRIASAGGLFLLSLLPMIVTNVLISGNPLRPPRLLPNVGPGQVELSPETTPDASGSDGGSSGASDGGGSGETAGSDDDSGSGGGTDSSSGSLDHAFELLVTAFSPVLGLIAFAETVLTEIVFIGEYALQTLTRGFQVADEGDRLWNVIVRRGYFEYGGNRLAVNDFELIDLTVLESTPVIGSLLALPAVAIARLRQNRTAVGTMSPRRQTDLLVVVYVVILTIVYLPRLPLFSQITVRYLLPAIALSAYCATRVPAVREGIETGGCTVAGTYVGTVVGGTVAVVLVLGVVDPALGEAIQFHALMNLCVVGLLAVLLTSRTITPSSVPSRTVPAVLGLVGGVTTVFVILAALDYFAYGPFALDFVREIAVSVDVM